MSAIVVQLHSIPARNDQRKQPNNFLISKNLLFMQKKNIVIICATLNFIASVNEYVFGMGPGIYMIIVMM